MHLAGIPNGSRVGSTWLSSWLWFLDGDNMMGVRIEPIEERLCELVIVIPAIILQNGYDWPLWCLGWPLH
jgi:hypothetical protein